MDMRRAFAAPERLRNSASSRRSQPKPLRRSRPVEPPRRRAGALVWAGALCTLLQLVLAVGARGAPRPTIVPRTRSAPTVDADLTDACWAEAAVIHAFTRPNSGDLPRKAVTARLCFDERALYVAFVCEEPHPDRIRTRQPDGEQVWRDDCVEIWIRTTDDLYEFDQFIVNAAGSGEILRRRKKKAPWSPNWDCAARVGRSGWRAEISIPFRALDVAPPKPGEMVQMKLGREDHTAAKAALSTWPPGSPYAGTDGYAPVYFETTNLLPNPDLSEGRGLRATGWGCSKGDEDRFVSVREGGKNVIRFAAPGRYCTLERSLRLRPNALYRLEANVKGTAGLYLRARTIPKPGEPSKPHTVWIKPSAGYVHHEIRFMTGPKGEALVILGATESTGRGLVDVAELRLVKELGFRARGRAIPIAADAARPILVRKLPVADCRAVRGFIGTPVDGSLESRGWNGRVWEYNQRGAGVGVGYFYKSNDGLHVTLADNSGFNAVVVRGGVKAKLYRDCPSYEGPEGGVLVAEFPGRTRTSRFFEKEPVATDRVSFFDVGDGHISNVSFFRVGPAVSRTARNLGRPTERLAVGAVLREEAPEITSRFPKDERLAYRLGRRPADSPIKAIPGKTFHLVTAPFDEEMPLAAVGLDIVVAEGPSPLPFTASVQDPLNPRSELFGADFELSGPGRVRLVLDFPDQVLPAGARLWLSLRFELPATLAGPKGGAPIVELYEVPRREALPEAVAYRKLLMKSYFAALSEPRPWNGWYTDKNIKKSLEGHLGPQLRELRDTIAQCHELAPEDPTVRQYYEWFWRQYRPWRKERKRGIHLDGSHAKIDEVAGAPEWAVVVRQAWLEARKVLQWWLDNRLVPTGEFGGVVGDDSDMYQNYADFVMFETDGVAARLKDAAARLAELAEETTLEHGLNRHTTDPLHAYEEGVNHEALMAWWFYGDPVYLERCIVAARSTESLTVLTPRGHRHFKSQRCGASDLRVERKTDTDGHAHPLMWHPAFEVAWYNTNPRVLKSLREWADGWLEHMEPGRYAVSVEVATEKVTRTTDRPLYGGYGALGSAFEFLYWITGDERYLGPFMERFRAGSTRTSPGKILTELLHRLGPKKLGERLSELARREGAAAAVLTGDKAPLIDALKVDIAELQSYREMYTSAEVFTDRVFLRGITNATIAYTGGYATRNKFSRTHAASYEGLGTDYAALVLAAGPDAFKVLLYNFRDGELAGRVRLWTLDHGIYGLRFGPDEDGDDRADSTAREETVEITRATAVPVALPPRKVMVLELAQEKKLDDIRGRADLAISPIELRVEAQEVTGFVHNIGSRAAENVEVALFDARGRKRDRKRLGRIAAPLDLVPRRVEFRLRGPGQDARGWTVRVDPEDRTPEIYEGNNRLAVPDSAAARGTEARLRKGKLLYSSSMADAESVRGWRMEGPGRVTFAEGWMEMHAPGEEMHHVFWCPEDFPDSFVAEWEAQNLHTEAGLCIVFFAAEGVNGEDIFDPQLPKRDGTFKQYTRDKIVSYHISYYANAAHRPARGHANLRKNNMFALVQKGEEGIPAESEEAHRIRLVKDGARVIMTVDGRQIIDWTDDGKTYGPPHTGGKIGFRQMKWTHFRYRKLGVWALASGDDRR